MPALVELQASDLNARHRLDTLTQSLRAYLPRSENNDSAELEAFSDSVRQEFQEIVVELGTTLNSLLTPFTTQPQYAVLMREVAKLYGICSWSHGNNGARVKLAQVEYYTAASANLNSNLRTVLSWNRSTLRMREVGTNPPLDSDQYLLTFLILSHLQSRLQEKQPVLIPADKPDPSAIVALCRSARDNAFAPDSTLEQQTRFREFARFLSICERVGLVIEKQGKEIQRIDSASTSFAWWTRGIRSVTKMVKRPCWFATQRDWEAMQQEYDLDDIQQGDRVERLIVTFPPN